MCRHVAWELKCVCFAGRRGGDGDGFHLFEDVLLIWWIINKCQEDLVCDGGGGLLECALMGFNDLVTVKERRRRRWRWWW